MRRAKVTAEPVRDEDIAITVTVDVAERDRTRVVPGRYEVGVPNDPWPSLSQIVRKPSVSSHRLRMPPRCQGHRRHRHPRAGSSTWTRVIGHLVTECAVAVVEADRQVRARGDQVQIAIAVEIPEGDVVGVDRCRVQEMPVGGVRPKVPSPLLSMTLALSPLS
jgi:hypothetical protein